MDTASKQAIAACFAGIAKILGSQLGVAIGIGKGLGCGALQIEGRIFAMCASDGDFVLKLPPERVAALIAASEGSPFKTGSGRVMRAWIRLAAAGLAGWLDLAREALVFVRSEGAKKKGATPKGRP